VPNDGHARHENTFLHYIWKRNHKWVKLKVVRTGNPESEARA